jgi:polyisoprenoid-binding protein YceI
MIKSTSIGCLLLLLSSTAANAKPIAFEIDPVHTQIVFRVEHAGFSHSFGMLLNPTGSLVFDADDWRQSSVNVRMKSSKVEFSDAAWNRAVHGKNYLNVTSFPELQFRSIRVEKQGDRDGVVHGELTLLGKTLPVDLMIEFNRRAPHPYTRKDTIGFHATARFKRSDFGMDQTLKTVGDWIAVQISLEANKVERPVNKIKR